MIDDAQEEYMRRQAQAIDKSRMRCPRCNEFVTISTFKDECEPHPLLGRTTHGFYLDQQISKNRKIQVI